MDLLNIFLAIGLIISISVLTFATVRVYKGYKEMPDIIKKEMKKTLILLIVLDVFNVILYIVSLLFYGTLTFYILIFIDILISINQINFIYSKLNKFLKK